MESEVTRILSLNKQALLYLRADGTIIGSKGKLDKVLLSGFTSLRDERFLSSVESESKELVDNFLDSLQLESADYRKTTVTLRDSTHSARHFKWVARRDPNQSHWNLLVTDVTQFKERENSLRILIEDVIEQSRSGKNAPISLNELLKKVCFALDFDLGIVSRIDGNDYYVKEAYSKLTDMQIEVGSKFSLEATYCGAVFKKHRGGVIYIEDVGDSYISSHPCYSSMGFNGYIGCPIYLGNEVYGTLNFTSKSKHIHVDRSSVISFFKVVASIVENWLEKRKIEEQSQRIKYEAKEQEVLFQMVYNHNPSALVLASQDRKIIKVNQKAIDIFGYSEEELLGKSTEFLYAEPAGFKRSGERVFNLKSNEQALTYDIEYKHKDGSVFVGRTVGTVIKNSEGELVGFLGSIIDISEQLEDKEKLSEAQSRALYYKDVLDEISIIAHTDRRGTILEVNDNFVEISGFSREELIGKNHRLVNSGHHPKEFFRNMWSTISQGKIWRADIKNRAKNGSYYWVDTWIVPTMDSDGKVKSYASIRLDITEKLNALDKVEAERSKVIQASKMSTLGEMAGGVAHEINNPLAIVNGFCTRLKSKARKFESIDSETVIGATLRIEEAVKRMAKIVSGLRTFARDGSLDDMEPVAISKIIESTMTFFQQRMENNDIDLSINIERDFTLRAREVQISQVLLNLLSNSFDSIMSNKQLVNRVRIDVNCLDGRGIIRVTDSGPGVPEGVVDKVFEPFFTTKGIGKGTGLGLSISKGIIEDHGGTIGVVKVDSANYFEIVFEDIIVEQKASA